MFDDLPFPILFGFIVAAVVLAVGLLSKLKFARWAVIGMFFFSSIAVMKTQWGDLKPIWAFPVQMRRSEIFLTLGVMLFLAVIGQARSISMRNIPVQGVLVLLIGCYAGMTRMIHETFWAGLASMSFALCTVLPLILVVPALLREWEDFLRLLRGIMFANMIWIGGVAVQFAINPALLTMSDRFAGMTGNPQSAGIYLAAMVTFALWLVLNDPKQRFRLVWIGLLGADLLMLMWTGSRTSTGMAIIGVMAATYGRFGRSVLALPFVALALYGAFYVAQLIGVDLTITERLMSTQDTRSSAWGALADAASENIFIGVGVGTVGRSENSYLFGIASCGIGMGLLMLTLLLVSIALCVKLFRQRWSAPPLPRALIDLVIGYNAMYFAGAFFEGFILARVAAHLSLMCIFSSMASRIARIAAEEPEMLYGDEMDADEADEADEGEWEDEYRPGVVY